MMPAPKSLSRHERALQIIRRWRLMDDAFMKRCLKDNIPAVECILRIIMERPDLAVLSVRIEDTIPSLTGRGIRMDVQAVDETAAEYDIALQRAHQGAGAKRARFNSSLLDLNSLGKGSTYENLPHTYVIFITEHDVWRHGLARYHVNRVIEELRRSFDDGSHIIYVNGAYHGTDPMGELMHDFRSSVAEDMVLAPLKEVVERYKTNPEEVATMCAELEKWSKEERAEGWEAGLAKGHEEGRAEGHADIAKAMLRRGMALKDIAELTGLSAAQIERLSHQMNGA